MKPEGKKLVHGAFPRVARRYAGAVRVVVLCCVVSVTSRCSIVPPGRIEIISDTEALFEMSYIVLK